jgi:hypothetical protein
MKQKALNVAVALAFGAVAAPSLAGTISVTPRQFPASIFGSPALSVAPVAYAISAPLAANVTRYFYIKLDNSSKFDATKIASGDFALTQPAGGAVTGLTFGTPVISADNTFIYVPITTAAAPAPINSTISYTPEAGAVVAGSTGALGTPGQQITATVSLGNNPSTTFVFADADAASNGPVAISVNPFTVTVVASNGGAPFGPLGPVGATENQFINVTSAGTKNGIVLTATNLTGSTTAIDFGSFKVTLAPNLFLANGTAVVNATDVASKVSFTVTGQFPSFATTTTSGTPYFDLSTSAFGLAGAITPTTLTASTVTFSGIPLVSGGPAANSIDGGTSTVPGTQYYFIANTDNNTLISSTTPVVSAVTFSGVGGSSTSTPTSTSLYPLGPNGGIVTVPTYVPAAVGGGYVSYYRVINTGTLTATPSVQVISEAGVSGAPGVLNFTIPPAGVHIFSSSDIEAAVGAVPASTRPRLRFTATTTINVQTLLTNPGGTLTTLDTFN